jgi:hypothetical protein
MINFLKKQRLRYLRKMMFLPQERYVRYSYEYYTGKKLNLENPKEYNEKIQWLKVFYKPKILNQLVDKYAVRQYVIDIIGEEYLNECYGVYDSVKEINFDSLPNQFVIKGVHGSGFNLIVKDKTTLDWNKSKKLLNKWMRINQYYKTGMEWAYKDVKPRLTVEKYLNEEGKDVINDYKFFCFNGKPQFLQIDIERGIKDYRCFYDINWVKQPFYTVGKTLMYENEVRKPSNFDEMIVLAEKLAGRLPFSRVDFYSVNGKTIFGEITFYPSDGRKDFAPKEYNLIIGDQIKLPKIPEGQKEITEY